MSEIVNGDVSNRNDQLARSDDQQVSGDAPTDQNAQPQEERPASRMESVFGIIKSLVIRGVIIYCITSFFRRSPQSTQINSTNDSVAPSLPARNLFLDGTRIELFVYLSENEVLSDFNPDNLFWHLDDLVYGDWSTGPVINGVSAYEYEKEYVVTDSLRNNGSLYMHAYVTKESFSPDPKAPNYARNQYSYVRKMLNKFKKLKSSTTKNLLTGETEKDIVEDGKIISHWHPNMTLNLVTDQTAWTFGTVPSPLNDYIMFTEDRRFYKPVLFANDFWNMAKDYRPLNESLKFRISYQPLSLFKWQLYAAQSMHHRWSVEEQSDEEQDTLKETLIETNPYLLGITLVVSILHSVFELLAFKNDIQFWNNRNSLEGLSVRSVFFGVFQSVVILLYVLDNDTNMIVRISCFVGLGIELWKIKKVVDIKFENGRLVVKDKGSYVESSTREYDKLAFKYLSWVCFPLLAGYSIYALLYMEHKGWYSFVLDILYGYLLTFGFIMMTPQLFINYKLQSVAHLPWRMMTYKFLNTFIDDMFAFVIKMPTMYRIGCFRDDIIFLVFLYQRWIYPVDKSRRNEFGYSQEQQDPNNVAAIEDKKTQ